VFAKLQKKKMTIDFVMIWCSWIRASWFNYENNQQDALYRLIYYSKSALRVELTWNNKLIYIVHLVGYFHSGFVISVRHCVCPSVRMEQLDSHWTDFRENLYMSTSRQYVKNIQVSLKYDKENW